MHANTKQFMVALKTNSLVDTDWSYKQTTLNFDDLKHLVDEIGMDVSLVHLNKRMRNSANIGRVAPADLGKYLKGFL